MKITYTNQANDPRAAQLVAGLVAFNESMAPSVGWECFAYYAENDEGRLLGGIHGHLEWDYLFVKHLWVAERGQGLGSVLLKEAEALARERGKRGVWLDTFEFQARGFYEKHGYTVFGTIPNAAGEYARYFLRKEF